MFEQIEPKIRECFEEARVPYSLSIKPEQKCSIASEYFPINFIVEGQSPKRETHCFYLDFKYAPLNQEIEVCWLGVSPRRRGIGRRLVGGLEQFAMWLDCNRIFLISWNLRSSRFWQALGYELNQRTGYHEKTF